MATIYFPSNLYSEFWEKIASNNNQTERGDRADTFYQKIFSSKSFDEKFYPLKKLPPPTTSVIDGEDCSFLSLNFKEFCIISGERASLSLITVQPPAVVV